MMACAVLEGLFRNLVVIYDYCISNNLKCKILNPYVVLNVM